MKLPRDFSGEDLARALKKFGYAVTRQTGSHMRVTATVRGTEHHVTIPAHKQLKIGTLLQSSTMSRSTWSWNAKN